MGATISNNSYNISGMEDAIAAAGEAGHLFVASAGNSGTDNDADPHYPASYDLDNIIAVAATDDDDNMPSWSNYGATSVDLAAPGSNIYSTWLGGGYGTKCGTSMAAPHVAGTAALIQSLRPYWSATEIKEAILSTVDLLPSLDGKVLTGGRLNAAAAVTAAIPPTVQIVDNGDASFDSVGVWTQWTGQGFEDDVHEGLAGTGTEKARWTFSDVSPGRYRVAATWTSFSNRATQRTFYDPRQRRVNRHSPRQSKARTERLQRIAIRLAVPGRVVHGLQRQADRGVGQPGKRPAERGCDSHRARRRHPGD